MIKTLLATTGVVLLAASGLQAAPQGGFGGARGSSAGAGARAQARPSANFARGYGGARYGYRGYRGGYYGHRYFFGGVPYFYDPFFFGFGYGYYGGFYGDPAGYGPYGYGYNNGAYDGQIVDGQNRNNGNAPDPSALPKEVQRQLSKRGYYRGSVDGEFGPASKSALTRFQQDNHLHATGRVDGATLKALGFEDRDGDRETSTRN